MTVSLSERPIVSIILLVSMAMNSTVQGGTSVCARVSISINQEAIISRDAFQATLQLSNGSALPLEEVAAIIEIRNESGEYVNHLFAGADTPSSLDGIGAIDGRDVLPPEGTATARWLIIPTDDAGPTPEPTPYFVGGALIYREGETLIEIPLYPVRIEVHPNPSLFVTYFLQSPVYSDNPFTAAVEPAEPFSLAMLMVNRGLGTANDVRITSSQPVITRNDRLLAVAFQLIAAQVNTAMIQPCLTVNLGDIGPSESAIARWLMTSTLQGEFVRYDATFEHVSGLNDPRLSLIEAVDIFELNHVVLAKSPTVADDDRPDFLVNNKTDEGGCPNADSAAIDDDVPDCVHTSDGTVEAVSAVFDAVADGDPTPDDTLVQVTATLPRGWCYVRLDNPGGNEFRLMDAMRDDGRVLPVGDVGNAWTTHRLFPVDAVPTTQEDRLHLFDYIDLPGTYTYMLTYAAPLRLERFAFAPTLQQRSNPTDLRVEFTTGTNLGQLIDTGTITDAVTLWRRDDGDGVRVPLETSRYSYDPDTRALSIDLRARDGNDEPLPQTILGDGNYELRISTTRVTSPIGGLLPDEDGNPDGFYRIGDDADDGIYRLSGDANGDRVVNFVDLQTVRGAWESAPGQSRFNPNADLNGDGAVNDADLDMIESNWLITLEF